LPRFSVNLRRRRKAAGRGLFLLASALAPASGLLLLFAGTPALAQESSDLPRLYTNEQLLEDVTTRSRLDINDTKSVLAYVLGQLPPRVRVFPTENYYYFYFYQNGVKFSGNLRFDVEERDKGLVEFIYFKDSTEWVEDETDHHATLGAADGMAVERVADLVYRLSYAGKSVFFELNDLSGVNPPEGVLGSDETYLGPVADESGVRFFLIFNESLKLFQYILDESAPSSDELLPVKRLAHVVLGRRTGFAYLKDPNRSRKILVGVYGPNADVNNYLDGPFDQLPDNFLKGDELRRAILLADPGQDSSIDRLGIRPGGDFRVSIDPYLQYYDIDELAPVESCSARQGPAVYECLDALVSEEDEDAEPTSHERERPN